MTHRGKSPRAPGRYVPEARAALVGALCLLVLSALSVAPPGLGAAPPDMEVAMSRKPPRDPIKLGSPALSPDGRLAALAVTLDEFLPRLVVFDLDGEELTVVDRPDNEGWLSPSFSPSGDRIAFIRYCAARCAERSKGFQIAILDRKSGVATSVTKGKGLFRGSPIFSLDGQSIVYGSGPLYWKDEFLARGLPWSNDRDHSRPSPKMLRMVDLKTRVEREILIDSFGVSRFGSAYPSGFDDDNTLIFLARGPTGAYRPPSGELSDFFGPSLSDAQDESSPLFRELKRLVGKEGAKYWFFGYKLTLGERLEFMSHDAPQRIGRVFSLSISSDTGQMVYIGLSGHDPENPKQLGYDIFLGNGETFHQATSLFSYLGQTSISKSGNRVAFLADRTRRQNWSLWLLDVATGRVWETSLKRRLDEWYRSSSRG